MPILILFLLLIVVVIPAFVWFWFANTNKYDDSGMVTDDAKIFYEFLNENILLKQMPFILGAAIEFNSLKLRQEEGSELDKLYKQFKEYMPKHKEEAIPFQNRKAICLVYAHIFNVNVTSPGLVEDTDFILKYAPLLISNMYHMAIQLTQMHQMNKNIKNFGYGCIKTIIEFSQLVHQRLALGASPFLQLPHFNENKLKLVGKNKKIFGGTTLTTFLSLSPAEKKEALALGEFTEEQIEDIEECSKFMPNYQSTVEAIVEGFEEILVEDLLTLKATVTRENLPADKEIGNPHSIRFPELFKEKMVILITNENRIIYEILLDIDARVNPHEFKHMIREAGLFKFKVEFNSFNYRGLDTVQDLEINILQNSEKRKEFIRAIEKREVKKLEPSLFQQMINSMLPVQEEDEEEEEEGDNKENQENGTINPESGEQNQNGENKLLEEGEIKDDAAGKRRKVKSK